jgi:hypothetical protein
VSEIADQIRDGVLIIRAAVLPKYRDCVSGPDSVVARIGHTLSSTMSTSSQKLMRLEIG